MKTWYYLKILNLLFKLFDSVPLLLLCTVNFFFIFVRPFWFSSYFLFWPESFLFPTFELDKKKFDGILINLFSYSCCQYYYFEKYNLMINLKQIQITNKTFWKLAHVLLLSCNVLHAVECRFRATWYKKKNKDHRYILG